MKNLQKIRNDKKNDPLRKKALPFKLYAGHLDHRLQCPKIQVVVDEIPKMT